MNQENFPQNVLPKELSDLPFGQLFVLTNPFLGITSKNIFIMQFIFSMARQYEKHHMVNAIPVEYSGLWDCVACKVQTCNGPQILIADNNSLVKMLCEFWGLDYEEVSKSIKRSERYERYVSLGGESHPLRTPVIPVESTRTSTEKDDYGVSLQLVQSHSRDITLGDIRSTFRDNFNYGFGISLEEVISLYKDEEKNRKSYKLDIQVKWKEVREYKHPKWVIHQKMTACDISLIDNFGNTYPIKIDSMTKAIYLTFLLFEDGIEYTQISSSDEFYELFKQIYKKLPRAKGTPKKFNLDNKADLDTFTNYTSKTRQAVLRVTNDTYAEEQFAIEGRRKDVYGIAGATADNRAFVRKELTIK